MRYLLLGLAIFLCGCSTEGAWVGKYTGTATESSQINRLEGETSQEFSGGQSIAGAVVSVLKSGDKELTVQTDRGPLKLRISSERSAEVLPEQHWQMSLSGYQGRMLMSGQALLDEDKLNLTLVGAPQEPGTSGGYAFTFYGGAAATGR